MTGWPGDSVSDMAPANTWTCCSSSLKADISIFSPERHTASLLLLFTAELLHVQDWNSHHTVVYLMRHGVAAALIVYTDSPDFPCSPSDFMPSSEGRFPEDSRICQVCSVDFRTDTKTKSQKILFSHAVLTQTATILFFPPTKIRLRWHQEMHPGAATVSFPL